MGQYHRVASKNIRSHRKHHGIARGTFVRRASVSDAAGGTWKPMGGALSWSKDENCIPNFAVHGNSNEYPNILWISMMVLNEHWWTLNKYGILNLYKIYKIYKSSFRICEYYNFQTFFNVRICGWKKGRTVFRSLPRDGKSCRTGLGRHMSIESIPRYSKKTHWCNIIYMIYNYVYIWYYGDSWIMKDP